MQPACCCLSMGQKLLCQTNSIISVLSTTVIPVDVLQIEWISDFLDLLKLYVPFPSVDLYCPNSHYYSTKSKAKFLCNNIASSSTKIANKVIIQKSI